MTHPLTPREKVDCVACEGRPAPENSPCAVCGRTALASGSGDHAELARLADMACAPMSTKTIGMHLDAMAKFKLAANPATVLALLAEIAALRGENERLSYETDDATLAALQVRATEAERKLAEAEEENGDMKERLSFASQLLRDYVVLTGEGHDVSVLNSETRTFLSKEAERG